MVSGLADFGAELINEQESKKRQQLIKRLNEIEKAVNKMKVPAFFANQFYSLRGHIDYVRELMSEKSPH